MLALELGGVTEEASFAVIAQNLLDNSTLDGITTVGWAVALLSTTVGTAYLARIHAGPTETWF
jgi:hypothetical protein